MLKKIINKLIYKIPQIDSLVQERNQLHLERNQLHQQLVQMSQEQEQLRQENNTFLEGYHIGLHFLNLKEERKLIETDYSYFPKCREWKDQPSIKKIIQKIEKNQLNYIKFLDKFAKHQQFFLKIPVEAQEDLLPTEPYWLNGWFPGLDAITLYGFIVEKKPKSYIEIGSGNSTKFARKAITDHNLKTKIISIDPHPRAEINSICDQVIRQSLEEIDLSLFESMTSEDILFVDNSHRSFQNSDVTVFFLEILPNLPAGTIYGIHDIFLPDDYPKHWQDRYYNEQYLLAAYLLGGADGDEIILPNNYISQQQNLSEPLKPIFSHPLVKGIEPWGGIFWMQRSKN